MSTYGNLQNDRSQRKFLEQVAAGTNELPANALAPGTVARSVVDHFKDTTSARSYGVYDNGSDCKANLQGLIDQLSADGGGIIDLPRRDGGFYGLSGPLALKSGAYLRGWGAGCLIKNTLESYVTTSREFNVFMAGTYHPARWDELTYYACDAVAGQTITLTTTTPADAGNLAAGDMVVVRSAEHYVSSGSNEMPVYLLVATVLSADAGSGDITLDALIDEAVANPQIAKVNGTGLSPGASPYSTLYMPKNCGLLNLSVESVSGGITELGGHYGLTIDVHNWIGDEGVYVNTSQRSSWRIRNMQVRRKAFDLAGGTAQIQCQVDQIEYIGDADPNITLCGINEQARKNIVQVGRLHTGDRAIGDVVKLLFCRGNKLSFGDIIDLNGTNSFATLSCSSQTVSGDQVQSACSDNEVDFGRVQTGGGGSRYVIMSNAGNNMHRNRIRGRFAGAVSTRAIQVAGNETDLSDCYFGSGAIELLSGATLARGRPYAAGGFLNNSGNAAHSLRVGGAQYMAPIPLTDFRPATAMKDALADTATGTAGTTVGHTPGNFGLADVAGSALSGLSTNGNAATNAAACYFRIPSDYVAGGLITLRPRARVSVARNTAQTIDATFQVMSESNSLGSDLCATAAQTLTTSYAAYEFTITPTSVKPGDIAYITLTGFADDTGGSSGGTLAVQWVDILLARA